MFRLDTKKSPTASDADRLPVPDLIVYTTDVQLRDEQRVGAFHHHLAAGKRFEFRGLPAGFDNEPMESEYVLALFIEPQRLDALADAVLAHRRQGRTLALIVAVRPSQLAALGR